MKIAVTGYYGFSNYGDDLFVIATKLGADKFWEEQRLYFISPPIQGVNANFSVPNWFPKHLYRNFGFQGKLSRLFFFVFTSLQSNIILNSGGSTISSSAISSKFRFELLLKKWFGIKLAGIGLSVGPFNSIEDQESAIDLLKNFEFISTRDKPSYEFVSQHLPNLEITRSSDLVGVIADTYKFDKIKKSTDIIGVSLMQINSSDKNIDVQHTMTTLLQYAIKRKMTVRVFILNSDPIDGDVKISETFISMLNNANVKYETIHLDVGALKVWEHISECTMMVSYRLHGAITAYLSNVPFYLFEYHQKCSDFLDDIKMYDNSQQSKKCTDFLQYPIHPLLHFSKYTTLSSKSFSNTQLSDKVSIIL